MLRDVSISGEDDDSVNDAALFGGKQGHLSLARCVASCISHKADIASLTHSSGLMTGLLSSGLQNIFGVGQTFIKQDRQPHDYTHIIVYFVGGVSPGDVRDCFEGFKTNEGSTKVLFVGGSRMCDRRELSKNLLKTTIRGPGAGM